MVENDKSYREEIEYESQREYEDKNKNDQLPEWISSLKKYFGKEYRPKGEK